MANTDEYGLPSVLINTYDSHMSRHMVKIIGAVAFTLVLAGCSGGSSALTGDTKACAIFKAWNNSQTSGAPMLHDWHNATTAALINDLLTMSRDMLADQISPSQQAAQAVLADAASVQAECASLGH
jgi:hypothetical protein